MRRLRLRPQGLRERLWLSVVGATSVALLAAVAGFNLLLADQLDSSATSLVRARAAAQVDAVRVVGGKVLAPEASDDHAKTQASRVWVFSGAAPVEAPLSSAAIESAARRLAAGPARHLDIPQEDVRLASLPVMASGRRVGTVVAEVSLAPYEETRKTALAASLALAGVVLALLALAARWLLGAALRPVRTMTRQAAEWSDRDPAGRFALGLPRDEFTELAATLDQLLERVAASLRREQRFSSEVSHELRTPIASLIAEAELALRREREAPAYRDSIEQMQATARRLARTVDTLVAVATAEQGSRRGTCDAEAAVARAVEGCTSAAAASGTTLSIVPPAGALRIGVDEDLVERILHPVLENSCVHGGSRVEVSLALAGAAVVIAVEDDGPGVQAGEVEAVFEPGRRGSGSAGAAGAGLGLALARRLARSADGEVRACAGRRLPGARFEITLPCA